MIDDFSGDGSGMGTVISHDIIFPVSAHFYACKLHIENGVYGSNIDEFSDFCQSIRVNRS
jgi:hypothetical protein